MALLAILAAELWHPACVVEHLVAIGELSPAAIWDMGPSDAIDQGAAANALTDPWDSDEWPALEVIGELSEDAQCAHCGEQLEE